MMNCSPCNAEIQPNTAEATGGLCMPCFKGTNKNFDARNDPRFARIVEQLTLLGCPNPEQWAFTEIIDGTPELSRFNVLREFALMILPTGHPDFLKGCERVARHFDLVAWEEGSGPLERLAANGVDLEDVLAVARCAQISLIAELASFFDTVSCSGPMVDDASWGLYEQSDDGNSPGRRIDDLHTSIFEPDVMEAVKAVPADG